MNWLIFIIVAVVLIAGVEYLSRSFPPPWRVITLAVIVVILLIYLLNLAGMVALPF